MARQFRTAVALCVMVTLLALACAAAVAQSEIEASPIKKVTVRRVLDGGRLEVRIEGKSQVVGLYGVHVPDHAAATAFLRERANGLSALIRIMPKVTWKDADRAEAIVYTTDLAYTKLSLNVAMLINGFAMPRVPKLAEYSPVDVSEWAAFASEATHTRRGLWLDGGSAFAEYIRSIRGTQEFDLREYLEMIAEETGLSLELLEQMAEQQIRRQGLRPGGGRGQRP